jgi:hypothetical protein
MLTGHDLNPRGVVYVVRLDRLCHDFEWIIGEQVRLYNAVGDSVFGTVLEVERFAHSPPWTEGEQIGLLLSAKGGE